MDSAHRLPVIYLGHGSPTNALEENRATRGWRAIGESVGPVRAILCVSAHWYTNGTGVTAMEHPRTIHDFGRSLPAPLFEISYPAPGSPELASRVQELLKPLPVVADHSWGLDHGAWSVLLHAWPAADVPIVQLSIDARQPDRWHYELGQQLRPLREEGVLVLASGNMVHNLGVMEWNEAAEPYDWAEAFNEFLKAQIAAQDIEAILAYKEQPGASLAVADRDHFLPLLYALGARAAGDSLRFETDYIVYKSLSMTSIVFG